MEGELEVEFLKIKNICSKGPVKNIPEQLTRKEYKKIRSKHDSEIILECLSIMQNTKFISRRQSVNLTLQTIIRKQTVTPEVKPHLPRFKNRYKVFLVKQTNGTITQPKIKDSEMANLIEFLKNNSHTKNYDGAYESFDYILKWWNKMGSKYLEDRTELSQILGSIQEIMIKLRKSGENKHTKNNPTRETARKDF